MIPQTVDLPKRLGQIDRHDKGDGDVDERDEEEDQPPAGATDDLQHDVDVVDRNDRGPPGLASFDERLPQPDNDEQIENRPAHAA